MRFFWLSIAAIPLMAASYTVDELTDLALQNDATLKAEREAVEQLLYQKEGTRVWENPELSVSYMRTRPDSLDNQNEYGVSLLQPIEKPSLRSAKQRVLDARIVQAKALRQYKEREIRGEVRQKAYLYAVAQQMAVTADESLSLASSLRQKGEKRFEQGAISKADLLKLQIEEEKTRQEAEAAHIRQNTARNLLSLAARLETSDNLIAPALPAPETPRFSADIDSLPMSDYYKAVAEEYRAQKEVATESVIPGVKAGIGYQKLYDQNTVAASLSIPIPIFHRNEALIKSADSRMSENRLREQAYRFETEQKAARMRSQLTSLATLIHSQEALIEEASKMVTLSQRSYEEGYGTLLELIDARRTFIAHQRERLNTLETYYDTLGEVEKIFPPIEEKQ